MTTRAGAPGTFESDWAPSEARLALLVFAAASAALLALAAVVPGHLDERVLLALRRTDDAAIVAAPASVEAAAVAVTEAGGQAVLALIAGGAALALALARRGPAAAAVVAGWAGSGLLEVVLKGLIARPRPGIVPHLVVASGWGMPSGHALAAASLYGGVAVLLSGRGPGPRVQGAVIGGSLLLAVVVGISRVVLGVHRPAEVLAGWAVGGLWAAAWSSLALAADRSPEVTVRE